jgi:hypothetical protein
MRQLAAQAAGLVRVMARSGILIAEPNKVQLEGGICQGSGARRLVTAAAEGDLGVLPGQSSGRSSPMSRAGSSGPGRS